MATSFNTFYDSFSRKHKDPIYSKLNKDQVERIFFSLLQSAFARFTTCYRDKTINYPLEQVEEDLTLEEIEITVEYMVLCWLEESVQNVENFQNIMTTADYKIFSNANMLSEKNNTAKQKQLYINELVASYGSKKLINSIGKTREKRKAHSLKLGWW